MNPTKSPKYLSERHVSSVAALRVLHRTGKYNIPMEKLAKEGVLIGRTDRCDFRIRHPSVSRKHCLLLTSSDGRVYITDEESKNGMNVTEHGQHGESRKSVWHPLKPGDHVRLGDVTLVAVDADGGCPITVKTAKELAHRAVAIYGSKAEACRRLEITRETLHLLLEDKEGPR